MLKKLFGNKNVSGTAASTAGVPRLDASRIRTLIEFFPIGKKLRYYPEFNKDIVLDTLIVGYCVNDQYAYSMEALEIRDDGQPTAIRLHESETRIALSAWKHFRLLVPDTSELEMKLDYMRRAQISRNGQFGKGNNITLISNAGAKGVSTVDTEVARQIVLHEGPYAHRNLVLLTPEFGTLAVTDQRRKPRTRTNVPVTVLVPSDSVSAQCVIVDMSEAEVRLRMAERGAAMPMLHKGDAMILDIRLGESERHYSVKGSVIRRAAETCVVQLDGQICDGRFATFSPLDLLELKAGLLNYGK